MPRVWIVSALALLLSAGAAMAAVPPADEETTASVRRVLTLLSVVGEEYREGVVDGEVVRPVEYEEARVFLEEARTRLAQVPAVEAKSYEADLDAIFTALDGKLPVFQVDDLLSALRSQLVEATGVTEQIFPPEPPSASRGRLLFAENCVSCHGEAGDGYGSSAQGLSPPPADFTDPAFMRFETPYDFFHIISAGKASSAMPAWSEVLSVQERWDLVSYLWTVLPGSEKLAEGQGVYLAHCASCHGADGSGQGRFSSSLLKPAPDWKSIEVLVRRTDTDLHTAVEDGIPGTPMPSFERTLSEEERWAVAAYLRMLSLGGDDGSKTGEDAKGRITRFSGLLRLLAEEYGKAVIPGSPLNELEYTESKILLAQAQEQMASVLKELEDQAPTAIDGIRSRLGEIASAIDARKPAPEVRTLVEQTRAMLDPFLESSETAGRESPSAVQETRRLLSEALGAYRDGNGKAAYLVSDAYFAFEPLEKKVAALDAALVGRIEQRFMELRGAVNKPGAIDQATAIARSIDDELTAVQNALIPKTGSSTVLLQSATIILREGFEIVLILGALLAYVSKSGNAPLRRFIWGGAAVGIIASLLTAFGLVLLFQGASGVAAEVLEGLTMLLASAVLFWVSYWLISKAEADKWQRFIQGKVKTALSRGSVVALAGVAFLAVYREGVETVLFYRALWGTASGQVTPLLGGFAAGTLALAVVSVLFIRFGMRIPIRQFFFATSALLYYLAFVFAGRGIVELQEAGWVSVTPVSWIPRIDLLGIHPNVESLFVQAVLILLVIYAVLVTWRKRRAPAANLEALIAQVQQLHTLAVEIRDGMGRLARQDPDTSKRLDDLVRGVGELEGQMTLNLRPNGSARTAQ
jgi:high-affinity iron transporter